MKSTNRFILLAVLGLALTACGGGGGGSSASTGTAEPGTETGGGGALPDPGTGNGNGGGTTPVTQDAIDKYMVAFERACAAEPRVKSASTGEALFVKETMRALAKVSATKAQMEYKHVHYAASDCSGPQMGSFTTAGADSWLTVDGSVDVAEGKADKVTFSEDNKLPGITAGGTITINGLTFTNGYTMPTTVKTLLLLKGSELFMGDSSKLTDAQGYYSALQTTATYRKP
jgi:hypothetical protein